MYEFEGASKLYKRVDEMRSSRAWSIYELAKRAGVTENAIYRWRDKKSSPSLYLLESISVAFEIPLVQLLVSDEDIAALTEEQQNLIKKWTTLKAHQKRAVLEVITAFELDT